MASGTDVVTCGWWCVGLGRELGAADQVGVIEHGGVALSALDAQAEQIVEPAGVAAGGDGFVEDAVIHRWLTYPVRTAFIAR